MRFVPHSKQEKEEMLKGAKVSSIEELFKDIPQKLFLKEGLKLGKGLSEMELQHELQELSSKNRQLKLFLGAGCYSHFIPAAVPAIVGRSEFYTAYTPYQPEMSQGMLQAIYEWQTYICLLTGMDVANASMYDGASACAEAMLMAVASTRKKKVAIAKGLNPQYRETVETYANVNGIEIIEVEVNADMEIEEDTACVIAQNPDFFGRIAKLKELSEKAHAKGALLVVAVTEALSLAFAEKPVDYDADIVAMEAQSFGNAMSFGGPHAGVIACNAKFVRQIPGRLVGKTVDSGGKEGFILTLQAREQHIRRENAGSNICSNQALCALASTVYLSVVGENGLKELAIQNHKNAKYLAEKLVEKGFELPKGEDFFNEFVVKAKDARQLQEKLLEKGFAFGHLLSENELLVAVTEMNSKEEIDELVGALQ